MRIADLMYMLEDFDEDMEILFQPTNSMYVEGFEYDVPVIKEVRRFYGETKEYLIIQSNGQVGAV